MQKVSLIGAGKVGTAFARALTNRGFTLLRIISRTQESASRLARETGAEYGTDYNIHDETELVIIAVPDRELPSVAEKIVAGTNTLIVHTAGSFGLEVFPPSHNYKCGVLYPLQTFSTGRNISLLDVPLFIEGETVTTLEMLRGLALNLSEKVIVLDVESRKVLHLAAVFASNFVNFMLTCAEEVAGETGLDFILFEPLVRETFIKAFENGPSGSQTGPAVRNDINTIEKHRDLLSFNPLFREIYTILTDSIINKYTR